MDAPFVETLKFDSLGLENLTAKNLIEILNKNPHFQNASNEEQNFILSLTLLKGLQ